MSIAYETEIETQMPQADPRVSNASADEALLLRVPLKVRLKVTLADFERLAQANRDACLELSAQGDLILMAPEGSWTGNRNFNIAFQLGKWIETHSGYGFGSSSGFIMPDGSCRSPDDSWIAQERWETLLTDEKLGIVRLCPDFVVELRSSTDSLEELQAKMAGYIANGARLGWLIDPIQKSVTIYRPSSGPELLQSPQKLSGEVVLPGFELDLTPIFAEPA